MNIKSRIKKVETNNAQIFDDWIENLSDEELERIVVGDGNNNDFAEYLTTLADTELELIRYGKPDANTIRGKFNEYKKQIEKDGKSNNHKRS